MKRIEIIWNLASEIIMSASDNGFDISYDKAQDMADKVLKRAEKEGMKAPLVDENYFDYMDNDYRKELNYYNSLHKWEDE